MKTPQSRSPFGTGFGRLPFFPKGLPSRLGEGERACKDLPTNSPGYMRTYRIRQKASYVRSLHDRLLILETKYDLLCKEVESLRKDSPPQIPLRNTPSDSPKESPPLTPHSKRRASRLPPNWAPSPEERRYAVDKGLDPDLTAERYRNHWVAKAGKDGAKLDWSATWRNWCISDAERKGTLTNGHDKVKPSIESQELLRLRREEMRRAGFNFLEGGG